MEPPMMFNNLGLYSRSRRPILLRRRRIPPPCFGIAQFGGGGSDVFINGTSGPPGPPGPPGPVGLVPVTVVNTTPYNALLTDYDLAVTANAVVPATVVLPVSPTGTVFVIKDAAGVASINSITVTAIAANIDGAAAALINTDYGSITLIFNGTEWNIV